MEAILFVTFLIILAFSAAPIAAYYESISANNDPDVF